MKALYYERFGGPVEVADLAEPVLPDGGAVVRVEASGLCRSDWHAWMGHDDTVSLPHVPGHEFAGEIVEIGSAVTGYAIGDQVAVDPSLYCGYCYYCKRARGNQCENWGAIGVTVTGAAAVAHSATSDFPQGSSQAWIDTVRGRGQSGALASQPTDFGPYGGSMSFDTTQNWFTGLDPTTTPPGQSAPAASEWRRTPPKRKAHQLAKHLRDERPDYAYLKAVFRAVRAELDVEVQREPKTLPYVPSEDEIRIALGGNLCRCTGYAKIVKAVQRTADELAAAR